MITELDRAKRHDRKHKWLHYTFGGSTPFLERVNGKTTACGKSAIRISGTDEKNRVDCPRCVKSMKLDYWYCEEHGFLPDNSVRNNETCDYCGRAAVV